MNPIRKGCVMRILLAGLFLVLPLLAQDTEKKEPAALVKARADYQRDILPITKKYLDKLETLKKELGGRGDLDGATAVQAEIEACTPEKAVGDKSIVGKWHARYPGNRHCYYTFAKDGKVVAENGGEVLMTGKWTMIGSGCIIETTKGSRETWTAVGPGKWNMTTSNDSAVCTRQ
jgi:hypothetical protein